MTFIVLDLGGCKSKKKMYYIYSKKLYMNLIGGGAQWARRLHFFDDLVKSKYLKVNRIIIIQN
jgi:hypothetical protein